MGQEVDRLITRIEGNIRLRPALWNEQTARVTLLERMKHYAVPGVSIAVVRDYRLDWTRAYGVKRNGSTEPVSSETLFQAGSISKLVTAVAALRLVQEGKLELDGDVNKYLVSWKVPRNGPWQPRITLRHLLSHSGGFTVYGFYGYRVGSQLPSLTDVLNGRSPANSPPIRVTTIPGLQFRYSGGGFTVLQQLLIDVIGQPFPELMRNLVFAPLGLEHSTYEQPLSARLAESAAAGHRPGGGQVHGKWHVYPEMAAAGLWTTASDLGRLLADLLVAKASGRGKLLSREMANEMLTPHVEEHVGLGVTLQGETANVYLSHTGSTEGFRSRLTGCAEGGIGAVVMTNSDAGLFLYNEVLRVIAKEYHWPTPGGTEPSDYLPFRPIRVKMSPQVCSRYVGEYEVRPGFRLAITWQRGVLRLQVPGQRPVPLWPTSRTEYFSDVVNLIIRFVSNGAGKVQKMKLFQNGHEIAATRVRSAAGPKRA